jgi:hypothetical protein
MRLMLHYRGPLKAAAAGIAHKHDLRRRFHAQLKSLWGQKPLSESPELLQPRKHPGDYSLLRPFGKFTFVPLVTVEVNAVAELSVTLLRPEPPGGLITQGGDIDNRLKTLFDALTMPRHANALPQDAVRGEGEDPFFCLLEDDNLVIAFAVRTEQLLEPIDDPSIVDVSIYVRTRVTRPTMGNPAFA